MKNSVREIISNKVEGKIYERKSYGFSRIVDSQALSVVVKNLIDDGTLYSRPKLQATKASARLSPTWVPKLIQNL